jgi:hypothetical protein
MSLRYPNVAKVELIAQALGPLCGQLVFVGGCAVDLLLTDPAAAAPRVTYDVDLLVQVAALPGYHAMEKQFSRLGFKRDVSEDAPICRWLFRDLQVDLMPSDSAFLDALPAHLPGDAASQARLPDLERKLRALANLP